MRDIKFRAWHTVHNVMYEPKNIPVLLKNVANDKVWKYMQFTGLKDRNGTDIYEGDIIATSNDGKDGCDIWTKEDWGYGVVQLDIITGLFIDEWASSLQEDNSVHSLAYVEVIGNIYANPELLEK